jgi:hypothetical protein
MLLRNHTAGHRSHFLAQRLNLPIRLSKLRLHLLVIPPSVLQLLLERLTLIGADDLLMEEVDLVVLLPHGFFEVVIFLLQATNVGSRRRSG